MTRSLLELLRLHMADFTNNSHVPQNKKAIFAFVVPDSKKVWLGTTIDATRRLELVRAHNNRTHSTRKFPLALQPYIHPNVQLRFFIERRFSTDRLQELKALLREHGYLVNTGRFG